MSDEYKIIKTVELSQNINGQNIKAEFDKIDDNFERLTGASITRGQDGVTRTHTFKFDGNGNCANKDEFKSWLTTKLGFSDDEAGRIIISIVNAFKEYKERETWYYNGSYEIYITEDREIKEALPIIYSYSTGDKKSLTYLQFKCDGGTLKLNDLNVVLQISAEGYWIVNGVTTSIKAQGEPGKDGKDGPGLDFGFVEVAQYLHISQFLIKVRDDHNYWSGSTYIRLDNFHELNEIYIGDSWIDWRNYSDENKELWYTTHKDDVFDVIFEEDGQLIIGKGKVEKYDAGGDTNLPIIGIFCNNIIDRFIVDEIFYDKNFHKLTRVTNSDREWVTWSTLSEGEQNEWYNDNKGKVFLTTNVEKTYMGYISGFESSKIYGMYLTESNIYSPGIGYNDVQGFFDNINYSSNNQGTPKGLWLRQPNEELGAVFFGNSGVGDNRANNLQIFAIDDYNKVCNSGLFNDSDKRDVNVNVTGSLNVSNQIKLGSILKIEYYRDKDNISNGAFVFGNLTNGEKVPRIGMYKYDTTTSSSNTPAPPGVKNGERYLQIQGNSGTTTIAPSQVTTNNITTTSAVIGSLNVSSQIKLDSILGIDKDGFIFGEHDTKVPGSRVGMYKYTNEVENKPLGIINGDKYLQVSRWNIEGDVTKYQTTTITPRQIGTTKIHTHDSLFIGSIDNDGGLKDGFKLDNRSLIFNNISYPKQKFAVYTAAENIVDRGINIYDKYIHIEDNNNLTTITPSQITTNKVKILGNLDCSTITINETTFTPITHNSPLDLNLDYARILYDSLNKLNILKKNGNNISISNGHYINNCCDLIIGSIKTIYYKYNAPTDIEHGPTIDLSNNSLTDFNACILYRVCGKIILGTNKTSDSTYYISVYDDTIEIDDFITIIPATNSNTITHYLIAPYGIQKGTLDTLYNIDFHNSGNINIKTKYETLDSLTDVTSSDVDFDVQRIRSFIKLLYNVDIVHGFSME